MTAVVTGTPAEASTVSLLQRLLVQQATTADEYPKAEAIDPYSQTPNASILTAVFSGMEAELDAGGARKGSLVRKASEESVGSADSFSVSRDDCWLGFEPAFGEILPGRSASIAVSKSKVVPFPLSSCKHHRQPGGIPHPTVKLSPCALLFCSHQL